MAFSLARAALTSSPHLHYFAPRIRCLVSLSLAFPRMSFASSSLDQPSHDSPSSQIPNTDPFRHSRSRLSPRMTKPTVLEKAEHALADHCRALEGDEAYRCWEALFEFQRLKEELKVQCDTAPSHERGTACRPLDRLEDIVRQSESIHWLISNVSMLGESLKQLEEESFTQHDEDSFKQQDGATIMEVEYQQQTIETAEKAEGRGQKLFPEPEGLSRIVEELEVEKSSMMSKSNFTRMLTRRGTTAPWFADLPDHKTD